MRKSELIGKYVNGFGLVNENNINPTVHKKIEYEKGLAIMDMHSPPELPSIIYMLVGADGGVTSEVYLAYSYCKGYFRDVNQLEHYNLNLVKRVSLAKIELIDG